MSYQPIPVHTADEINAMTDREYRSYEARLRRAVARQGHVLQRSRRRDPRAVDYNTYLIADPANNTIEAGPGMYIDDVARWVNDGMGTV